MSPSRKPNVDPGLDKELQLVLSASANGRERVSEGREEGCQGPEVSK